VKKDNAKTEFSILKERCWLVNPLILLAKAVQQHSAPEAFGGRRFGQCRI
jgi:hypothetical protein